ncbi:hypothetical protein BD408DRAFT_166369 [Parasitella parasitica]|nr:hypothetical protein BD408DRAFT_166369 [Parasitella parasitica]
MPRTIHQSINHDFSQRDNNSLFSYYNGAFANGLCTIILLWFFVLKYNKVY